MIRRIAFIALGLLLLFACKSKKVVTTATGNIEMLSPKKAAEAILAKPVAPAWVQLKADVSVTQNGSTNNGVIDIRMKQDSMLWVEIADPFLGIKAIRAFAQADSVAYVNRIEKTYFAGPYTYVEQKLGTSVPFNYIFNVFLGEVFLPEASVSLGEKEYLLQAKTEDGNSYAARIEPLNLDCIQQVYFTAKDVLTIRYSDYRQVNGYRFPHKVVVQVEGSQQLLAVFTMNEVASGTPLDMPFNISKKYSRIY